LVCLLTEASRGCLPRFYLSDRLSEAHSLQLAWAELGRSPLASWLSRRTQYCLWSCLTDAVRRRVASSRKVRGTFTSKTHFKVRCRSE